MAFHGLRERWREVAEITNVGPIARRYFVIGAFDGALTVLGIVIGAAATLGDTPTGSSFVVIISFAAALALAISSTVGAYEAERVEKKVQSHSIERAMLAELSREHKSAFRLATLYSAGIHGIAPLVAALIPIIPFLIMPFRNAAIFATVMTLVFLFGLGAYLGSLIRERIFITGLRFVGTGLGTALLLWSLGTIGIRIVP